MKKIVLLILGLFFIVGCNDNHANLQLNYDLSAEFELLSSEIELNSLLSRNSEGIVDWQLSREFAQMALDNCIIEGDYPDSSKIWEFPIGIYSDDGQIRYYEFRVVNNETVIAAITCNARENLGGPISYIFSMNGYMDEITKLYNDNKLSTNEIPRIIDNAYPSYAIGISETKRSGDIQIENLINPITGEHVSEVTKILTVEESFEEYPDAYTDKEKEIAKAELDSYKSELKEFWKMAKTNKGNIETAKFRGAPRNIRQQVDNKKIQNAIENSCSYLGYKKRSIPLSYQACGATATGFILDYLYYNNFDKAEGWAEKTDRSERISLLRDVLKIPNETMITWPWNIGRSIEESTKYDVVGTTGIVPKSSINNNIPGINLRSLKSLSKEDITGGFHYRNVIGYKTEEWFIFQWDYMLILDGNGFDSGWESYTPLYHLQSWDVIK